MFPATEFRVAVGYLLVVKIAVGYWLAGGSDSRNDMRGERLLTGRTVSAPSILVQLLYLVPAVVYVLVPELVLPGQLILPATVSWVAIGVAAGNIVVFGWAWRSITAAYDGDAINLERLAAGHGPFRVIRYPYEVATATFHIVLSVATTNWWIVVGAVFAPVVVRWGVIPALERKRGQHWGEAYAGYSRTTGIFLPRVGDGSEQQYTVPRRFGMAAIVALFTTLGILFGVLRYWEASPFIYLFVTSEIAAICLAQIAFGSAPRVVSIVLGAVLLPFWVYLDLKIRGQTRPPYIDEFLVYALFTFLFAFGGLLGYCIGALAAGFFLVMDLVEATWERPQSEPLAVLTAELATDQSSAAVRQSARPVPEEEP
jgi:protein-S-isoprenylcysteine O-methyltransferase Ste14